MYKVCKEGCTHVGFELWQVKSGTIFDDIIITDSLEEAKAFAEETSKRRRVLKRKCTIRSRKNRLQQQMPWTAWAWTIWTTWTWAIWTWMACMMNSKNIIMVLLTGRNFCCPLF